MPPCCGFGIDPGLLDAYELSENIQAACNKPEKPMRLETRNVFDGFEREKKTCGEQETPYNEDVAQ